MYWFVNLSLHLTFSILVSNKDLPSHLQIMIWRLRCVCATTTLHLTEARRQNYQSSLSSLRNWFSISDHWIQRQYRRYRPPGETMKMFEGFIVFSRDPLSIYSGGRFTQTIWEAELSRWILSEFVWHKPAKKATRMKSRCCYKMLLSL